MDTCSRAKLCVLLLLAVGRAVFAQSMSQPDVPTGLLERKDWKIVNAPPEDFALAKTYHDFRDKGPLVDGQRITIMTRSLRYKVGEPVRVLHVLEAVEPGIGVYVMGPKTICDEYVDGKLVTPQGPGQESYRGMVIDNRPLADFNYEITTYRFTEPGEHTIQWKGGGHPIQGSLGLESNIIRLHVVRAEEVGLAVSIAVVSGKDASVPQFRVTIENIADKDILVNLGMMLGNGKALVPDAIRLMLTDSTGRTRNLCLRGPAGVAGRVDDYLVPLRRGCAYVLGANLEDYGCRDTQEFRISLAPGEYQVRAELEGQEARFVNGDMQGIKTMNLWTGRVQSDAIALHVPGEYLLRRR